MTKALIVPLLAIAFLAGCTSPPAPVLPPEPPASPPPPPISSTPAPVPESHRTEPEPARLPPARPEIVAEEPPADPAVAPAPDLTAVTPGNYLVSVESQPDGATVVVDGVPVGRTPCQITLPGTDRGFFRTAVSVRVRFIAEDPAFASATVEEAFAQTDRIPSRILFTPTGAKRDL